ncbi:hypothetical protein GGR55DRAFT_376250 [Xylaria sp. FL0064]|nr:hypothetical protein GGR55DRAFT_376250 [Xylaria sp. FL0064]
MKFDTQFRVFLSLILVPAKFGEDQNLSIRTSRLIFVVLEFHRKRKADYSTSTAWDATSLFVDSVNSTQLTMEMEVFSQVAASAAYYFTQCAHVLCIYSDNLVCFVSLDL